MPTDPRRSHEQQAAGGLVGDASEPVIAYELRIGVTGHRQLDDPEAVRTALYEALVEIAEILTEGSRHPEEARFRDQSTLNSVDIWLAMTLSLATRAVCPVVNAVFRGVRAPASWRWPTVPPPPTQPLPHQETPLKFTGISCLAEGTDQLFVEALTAFLSDPPERMVVPAGARSRYLEAVLPLPVEEYEKCFSTSASKAKLHALLRTHPGISHVPAPVDRIGGGPGGADAEQRRREAAFATANRLMIESSEIVIAVWDPRHEVRQGGTQEAVSEAVERGRTVIWIDPGELSAGRRVLGKLPHGAEAREAISNLPEGLFAQPLPAWARGLSLNFHRLSAYNRDPAVQPEAISESLKRRRDEFAREAQDRLPRQVVELVSERLLPHVVRADLLSLRYRGLRDASARLWPIAAATAVSVMAVQILFFPGAAWLAWFELLLLLTCLLFYRVSVSEAWHDKWRNDRRIAETLRTANYTALVPESRNAADATEPRTSPHPLPFYNPDDSWFLGTLKRIMRREERHIASVMDVDRDWRGIASFLADAWIRRQVRYHAENAERQRRRAARHRRTRWRLIGLILLACVLHGFGVGHPAPGESHGAALTRFDLWVGWGTIVLPAWAAALHVLSSSEDRERLAERSSSMVPLLEEFAERMDRAESADALRAAVRDAESLFDLESQEWAESLSERRPEFTG